AGANLAMKEPPTNPPAAQGQTGTEAGLLADTQEHTGGEEADEEQKGANEDEEGDNDDLRIGRRGVATGNALGTTRGEPKTAKKRRKKKRAPNVSQKRQSGRAGKGEADPPDDSLGKAEPKQTKKRSRSNYVGSKGSVLYAAATVNSDLIRPLTPGETVEVLTTRRGKDKRKWAVIRTSRGERGFVRLDSIQSRPPAAGKVNRKGPKGKPTYPPVGKGSSQVLDMRDTSVTAQPPQSEPEPEGEGITEEAPD
ncbi:SH3 domain-containing protein, partial [Myxococcota bacterium]